VAHTTIASLVSELSNLLLLFLCLIKVGLMTGLIAVPLIVTGHALMTRKRVPRG